MDEMGRTMPPPTKIKVLIAHGNVLICAGLARVLERDPDFEPFACGTGLPVTSLSPGREPDVVISDYESGLRMIASTAVYRNRVIILTHSDSEAEICHALENGARGYILLGCSLEELIESLKLVHLGGIALGPTIVNRVADRIKQHALTRRECEVLGQVMLGLSNKAIALRLALAVGTVKTHVKSILEKLEATSRTQAVAIAQRRGLLPGQSVGPVKENDPSSRNALGRVHNLREKMHARTPADRLG